MNLIAKIKRLWRKLTGRGPTILSGGGYLIDDKGHKIDLNEITFELEEGEEFSPYSPEAIRDDPIILNGEFVYHFEEQRKIGFTPEENDNA